MRTKKIVSVVYTAHGFHFHPCGGLVSNWLYMHLEKLAGRWTDALIVINKEDYKAARQYGIVAETILCRMPGIGIDLEYWNWEHVDKKEVDDLRQRLKIESDSPVLLCVGDLIPRKRHGDLLRGFAEFLAQQNNANFSIEHKVGTAVPAVRGRLGEASLPSLCTDYDAIRPVLILAGDGPLRITLEALARELGIAKHVRFVGFQYDLRAFYALADATVLVSLQEGLPRSLMESLAMETPVIATDVRGNHELVDDSCGFLVPPRDAKGLTTALQRLFSLTHDQRRELGRRARERMADYSLTRCLATTQALYESLIGRN
jgi:glycosyltransferase involved in cell wall biosynthesis